MRIQVCQRGGTHREPFIEALLIRVGGQIMSTRLLNTLQIRVECRATKLKPHVDGVVRPISKKEYLVIIQRDDSAQEIAETIAHEIRHIEQFARGRLRVGKKGDKNGWFWRPGPGEASFYPFPSDYATAPWEVEARETESLGKSFLREYQEGRFS